jgi:hypothetical protein
LNTIKAIKPIIFKGVVGKDNNYDKLKFNSFKLQCKLADSKSDFANKLLFDLIQGDSELPALPAYITTSLEWLSSKLNKNLK